MKSKQMMFVLVMLFIFPITSFSKASDPLEIADTNTLLEEGGANIDGWAFGFERDSFQVPGPGLYKGYSLSVSFSEGIATIHVTYYKYDFNGIARAWGGEVVTHGKVSVDKENIQIILDKDSFSAKGPASSPLYFATQDFQNKVMQRLNLLNDSLILTGTLKGVETSFLGLFSTGIDWSTQDGIMERINEDGTKSVVGRFELD